MSSVAISYQEGLIKNLAVASAALVMMEGACNTWIAVHVFPGQDRDDRDNNNYLKTLPGDILVSVKENQVTGGSVIDIPETSLLGLDIWIFKREARGSRIGP